MKRKFYLSIILTESCNLRCSYCYENTKSKRRINPYIAKKTIAFYLNSEQYDEIEIDLFGGEPFAAFDLLKEICEWVWSKQWKNSYIFFATSNGTLIHGKVKEWLKENKDRIWVSLSIDGTRESHNINRSNSFDSIDVTFFKECWPTQTVKMTISKETIGNLYNDIVYLHSLGFDVAGSNFAEGLDWENHQFVQILHEQLEKLSLFYINNPQIKPAPLLNMPIHLCEIKNRTEKTCGTGATMATCGIDGKMYPCTFFTPMTFSTEQLKTIENIDWNNDKIFVDKYCKNNCYLNPVCSSCYGANFLNSGRLNERDKSKCELVKIRAIYTAAIQAKRIIESPQDTYTNYLLVKAIQQINTKYNQNDTIQNKKCNER